MSGGWRVITGHLNVLNLALKHCGCSGAVRSTLNAKILSRKSSCVVQMGSPSSVRGTSGKCSQLGISLDFKTELMLVNF